MKKIALCILVFFTLIASIFGFYLYSVSKTDTKPTGDLKLKTEILNKSSWIYLTEEDFYGYLNETYTPSVQTIINSLEEAIPVIFHTSNNKFGKFEDGTFIVASAFDASNKVYVYYYNSDKEFYQKSTSSLESILEDANAAYIYNLVEGLE